MARTIPAATISIVRERAAGRLLEDGSAKPVNVIQPKPVQLAFHRYLEAAGAALAPLSAVSWKRQQQEFTGLDDDAWLLYAIHAIQMLGKGPKGRLQQFQIERHEAAAGHLRSGNIVVTDMTVWKKI